MSINLLKKAIANIVLIQENEERIKQFSIECPLATRMPLKGLQPHSSWDHDFLDLSEGVCRNISIWDVEDIDQSLYEYVFPISEYWKHVTINTQAFVSFLVQCGIPEKGIHRLRQLLFLSQKYLKRNFG